MLENTVVNSYLNCLNQHITPSNEMQQASHQIPMFKKQLNEMINRNMLSIFQLCYVWS